MKADVLGKENYFLLFLRLLFAFCDGLLNLRHIVLIFCI